MFKNTAPQKADYQITFGKLIPLEKTFLHYIFIKYLGYIYIYAHMHFKTSLSKYKVLFEFYKSYIFSV